VDSFRFLRLLMVGSLTLFSGTERCRPRGSLDHDTASVARMLEGKEGPSDD
jgi:hypothetical protein